MRMVDKDRLEMGSPPDDNIGKRNKTFRRKEAFFSALFDAVGDTIFIFDASTGEPLFWNQAFREVSGFSDEEIALRKAPDDWYDQEDLERAAEATRELLTTGHSQVELSLLTKDGGRVLTEYCAAQITDLDGVERAIVSIGRDLSKRQQAEAVLDDSERRYFDLLEAIPDIVVVLDWELNPILFNDAASNRLGMSREQLQRTNYRDLFPGHEETVFFKTVTGVLESRKPDIAVSEFENHGVSRWFELTVYPVPEGVLFFSRDITEQKQVEDRLRQSQKMEAIATLAGGIAHDFNNLLMGIQGRVSLMSSRLSPEFPHYDRLKEIEDIIQSGANLTRQLLGYARGGNYETRPTDLNDLVSRCLSMFSRTRKEIDVHTRFDEHHSIVEVDRGQLERVLLNLLINASQAMPGGGEIVVETTCVELSESFVRPYVLTPGWYAKISVSDKGEGMDRETLEQVFEPFFTTKEAGHGVGLGLASSYGIVKNHNGIITPRSVLGQGTTFDLFLPTSNAPIPEEPPSLRRSNDGAETIMLIDDEGVVRDVTGQMLSLLGYEVRVASCGRDGLDIFTRGHGGIDLIILDMIMPGENALEIFRRLRKVDPKIKVLLSSGYSIKGQARALLDEGCDGFIQKPFNTEVLSSKLRKILDRAVD